MSGQAGRGGIPGRAAFGLCLAGMVLASPLAGIAAAAAWQIWSPETLRAAVREVTAFTHAGGPGQAVDQAVATVETDRHSNG